MATCRSRKSPAISKKSLHACVFRPFHHFSYAAPCPWCCSFKINDTFMFCILARESLFHRGPLLSIFISLPLFFSRQEGIAALCCPFIWFLFFFCPKAKKWECHIFHCCFTTLIFNFYFHEGYWIYSTGRDMVLHITLRDIWSDM